MDFEKDFLKQLNNGFFGELLEKISNRVKLEFINSCENDEKIKQQLKLPLNDIDKSYINYSSYSFKQNEVLMNKPVYVGLAII